MDYILSLAPLTILIIVCIVIAVRNKKKKQQFEKENKITQREQFEKTCIAYEKRTLLLRIYVIYVLPLQMILSALWITAYIRNEMEYSLPVLVFCMIYEIIRMICIYFVRKNALALNKKGYISLIAYFSVTMIIDILFGDISSVAARVLLLVLFYIYVHKRSSLFNL